MTTARIPIASALCVALAAFASVPAIAQYPEKPIRLVIPFTAGGGSDALARTLQGVIEKNKLLSKPLVVVNVDAAGGAVAMRQVKDAPADGYTFLQMHQGMFAFHATGRTDFGADGYEPVIQTTQACVYLAVPSSSPYKTLKDLVEAGKKDPGKLKYADGVGGLTHFPMAVLQAKTGARFGIVQTGSTAKRFASLKGGHTDMAMMSTGWLKRGGDALRGIAAFGTERIAGAPDMPTVKEAIGHEITSCITRRFWAPKGTPADRIKVFADAIEKAVDTPELDAFHKKSSQDKVVKRGPALAEAIAKDVAGYAEGAPVVAQDIKGTKSN
jgi:tripartite-type tricarboxylate transporter receptor subunit TctC